MHGRSLRTLQSTLMATAFAVVVTPSLGLAQALLPAPLPDDVVARRGGVDLTLQDVDAKIRTMPPELRSGYLDQSDRAAKLIDSVLLTKQIALRARELGLEQDPEYKLELEQVSREILSRLLIERTVEQAPIPDVAALAEERYIADPKAITPPPRIDVSHVLVETDGMDEEAARKLAEDALARAKAGQSFAELVAAIDNAKVTTEAIQMVDLTRMDPKFARAVNGMKQVGDLAGPVRSRFGYHIIQLDRMDVVPTPPFEKVKDAMIAELEAAAKDKVRRDFLSSYSQQGVELNDEAVKSLRTRYANNGEPAAGTTANDSSSTAGTPGSD